MHRRTATDENHHRKAILLIVFVTLFAALYFGQGVFIPLALALLLTFVLAPLADWLERHRFPRAVAAVCVVAVVCTFTITLSYVVGNQIVQFATNLGDYRAEITRKINTLQGTGSGLTDKVSETLDAIQTDIQDGPSTAPSTGPATDAAATQLRSTGQRGAAGMPADAMPGPVEVTKDVLTDAGKAAKGEMPDSDAPVMGSSPSTPVYTSIVETSALGRLGEYAGWILGPLGTLGLVLVLVLFMLLERDDLRDRLIRLTSGGRYTVTTQALGDATTRVGRYLRAQLIVNGTYGVAIALGLWIIGATVGHGITFPSFILWGALCGVLRFIPYVGPWVAAAFPLAVSLAVYEGFNVFFATAAMFVVIELISNNFMEPVLYGSSTGISTVALLVAAIIWTTLWGAYGLLLSTPLTVCLVVLGKHVPQLSFLDVLLGDTPALAPNVRFYQRLLAGDRADAADVLRDYATEHGTIAAADDVVVPALRLARHDRRNDDLTAQEEADLYAAASEVVEEARVASEKKADAAADRDDATTAEAGAREATLQARPLVIGMPAHHRAEVIATQVLAGLIDPLGGQLGALSCSLLPSDIESQVAEARPAAVVICVMPPGGLTQARYLCRRLRRRFHDLPIIVTYLGTYRDYDALLVRFRASGATYVTTSISQSRSQLVSLLRLKVEPDVDRLQVGPPREDHHAHQAGAAATRPPVAGDISLCGTSTALPQVKS